MAVRSDGSRAQLIQDGGVGTDSVAGEYDDVALRQIMRDLFTIGR